MLWPYTRRLPGHVVLPALDQVALDHHAEDRATSRAATCSADRRGHVGLPAVVLLAVAVRAVDHHALAAGRARPAARRPRRRARRRSSGPVREPPRRMTWQVSLPRRLEDGRHALLGHRREPVRRARAASTASTAICDVAVGAVLEADRHRQARRQLAVHLALGRPRADGDPRRQVGDVLRDLRVEELGRRRQAHVVDVEQQLARQAQPLVDVEALVEVGVVDEPLPADRRPRLLEVARITTISSSGDSARPAPCSRSAYSSAAAGVVDRAGPDDDDQARVVAAQACRRWPRRASATMFEAARVIGISSSRMAGGISGRTWRMRRSSVRRNMVIVQLSHTLGLGDRGSAVGSTWDMGRGTWDGDWCGARLQPCPGRRGSRLRSARHARETPAARRGSRRPQRAQGRRSQARC